LRQPAKTANTEDELPEILYVNSKYRKLGILNVLDEAPQVEFRTAVEIDKDEEAILDQDMREKFEDAWKNRSDDKFRFPAGTDDWLIVDTVRYKDSDSYSNGKFKITVDRTTLEHFGKSVEGVNISLQSDAIDGEISRLKGDEGKADNHVSRIMPHFGELQDEALRIATMLHES
jgi:hypothetical protein